MPPTEPPPLQGHWQTAQILQAETGTANGHPLVAVDAKGGGLAAWDVEGGISFRRFDPTTGWAPLQLMRVDGLHRLTALVMNPAGVALMVWVVRENPTLATVWASQSNPDSDWRPAQRLDEDDGRADFSNFYLDAAISSGGGAVVVWTAFQVYAARFDPLAGWRPPEVLSQGPAAAPSVAIDSDGNGIAVWRERTRGASARFLSGAGWRPEDDYDVDPGPIPDIVPQIAVDASGRGLLVWTRSRVGVRARQFLMGTPGWGPAVVLQDSSGQTFPFGLALNARGDGVTAWGDTVEQLWAAVFEPPNTWRQPERLVASDFRNAQIGIDAGGNRLVVFTQWNGTRDLLSARRYVPPSGWGAAEPIDRTGQSLFPRLAVDPVGRALVVWSEFLPPTTAIWANRFETGSAP